ncbi:MAG: putative exopolysaccharide biosynthesis protein [Pseudomonas sp.]|nr:putative exopolysaccharide biosynthesis protein [Pseudomonas sp.]
MNSPSLYIERSRQPVLHQQPSEERDVIDFLKLWRVIWRAKWNIAWLMVLVCALTIVAVFYITPQYTGSATVLIEDKTPPLLTFQQVTDSGANAVDYLQTQLALLQSRDLAERAVKKLHLTTNPLTDPRQQPAPLFAPRKWLHSVNPGQWLPWLGFLIPEAPAAPTQEDIFNQVTQDLMLRTSLQFVGKSHLIEIDVQLPDPDLAAAAANALAQGFIDSQQDNSVKLSQSTSNWMNTRLIELRNNLRDAETKLQAYREAQGLVDVDGVATISANELQTTGNRMIDARSQRADAESQYRQVQALSNGHLDKLSSVPAVLSNPLVQQFQAEQAKAQAKVEEMSNRYGPKHPTLIAARSELATATTSLRLQVQQVVAGIERNYQLAQANEGAIRQSFNNNKQQIQDISRKEFQLREFQREVDSSRDLYETFITRFKETSATSDINSAKARIVDPAIAPIEASKPRKSLIVAIAALVAAVIGVALALLFDALRNTVRTDEDIEAKLHMPLISVVPRVSKRSRRQLSRMFDDNDDPRFCETIRNLRTWLMLHGGETPPHVVLIASTVPGEGKSTIANNLARSLAPRDRVLLIDADLRKPSLSQNFDLPPGTPGLANVLAGTARLSDCIRTVGGYDMLPAGMLPPSPLDLLSSPRMAKLLLVLRSRYQRIIIDSPPTQTVSDALVLATHSDAVIYVVKADSTSISEVQKCLAILQQHDVPVSGVVLNQVDLRHARKYGYSHADTFYNGEYLPRVKPGV